MSHPYHAGEGLSSLHPSSIMKGKEKIRFTLPSPFGRGAQGEGLEPNPRMPLRSTSVFGISPARCSPWFFFLIFPLTLGTIASAGENPAAPPTQNAQAAQVAYDRAFQLLGNGHLSEALAEI